MKLLKGKKGRQGRTACAICLLGLMYAGPCFAQGEITFQYLYDERGQLVRTIDSQGNVVTWTYDAVGNIVRIDRTTVGQLAAPTITGITPNAGKARSTVQSTIAGAHLAFATVTTDNPGVAVSQVLATDASVAATFTIAETARLGPTIVTVETGIGRATVPFTVTDEFGVASLTLSPTTASVAVGVVQQFIATPRDPLGQTIQGVPLVWTSFDQAVATVSQSGGARGVSPGAATITATHGSLSAAATLTVTPVSTSTTFRVIVLESGPTRHDPTPNARVLLNDPTTGALLGDRVTDAGGVADFGETGQARATVSFVSERPGTPGSPTEKRIFTFVNIPAGDLTVSEGSARAPLATVSVTLTNVPSGSSGANVVAGDSGSNATSAQGVIVPSAVINDLRVEELQDDLRFSILGQASGQTGNVLACGFLADLDPIAVNNRNLLMALETPPFSVGFSASEAVVFRERDVLRKGLVFKISVQGSGSPPATSGTIPVCVIPGGEKAEFAFATRETSSTASKHISRIFTIPAPGPPVSNLVLPNLAIGDLSRLGNTVSWSQSGADLGQMDFTSVELRWRADTTRYAWSLVADPATTTSVTLPALPADLNDRRPPAVIPEGSTTTHAVLNVDLGGLNHVNGFQDLAQRFSQAGGKFEEGVKFGATEFIGARRTRPVVAVTKIGNGSGRVRASDGAIDCGLICSSPFAPGASIVLTAVPDAGSRVAGISGPCLPPFVQDTCTLQLTGGGDLLEIRAQFEPLP